MDELPPSPGVRSAFMVEQSTLHIRILRRPPPVSVAGIDAICNSIRFNIDAQRVVRIAARQAVTPLEILEGRIGLEEMEASLCRVRAVHEYMKMYASLCGYSMPRDDNRSFPAALRAIADDYWLCRLRYEDLLDAASSLHSLLMRTEINLMRTLTLAKYVISFGRGV